MGENPSQGQSGGVNITGTSGSITAEIVGRDKIVGVPVPDAVDRQNALRPIAEAITAASNEKRAEAEEKLAALTQAVTKAKSGESDAHIAKLVDGLVALVPTATSAIVSAFATPILGGIAGPVTKFVLDKLRGE